MHFQLFRLIDYENLPIIQPGPSLGILGMGPGPLKLGKIALFWIELGKFSIN